jgi:predicted ATP-dependent endonuclease of OLD family
MSKIKIKNFGPIKNGFLDNDGWMDIKKTTVFIGNQGSGKSSVAKLISTLTWMEKVLVRQDYKVEEFTNKGSFRTIYCAYHRIEDYFYNLDKEDVAVIAYQGDAYNFYYQNTHLSITKNETNTYQLPQTMYVPSERNFISTIQDPKSLKLSSDALSEFLSEFNNAKQAIKKDLALPINDARLEYNGSQDVLYVKGTDYKVELSHASSGFQAFVPLYIVSWFLANAIKKQLENPKNMSSDELDRFKKGIELIWADKTLTDEQRRAALSVLSSNFNKSAFINIVEEPEQNLYPSSQRQMLNSLLAFNNLTEHNVLVLTTHSPYIINYLSIAIQGDYLKNKIGNHKDAPALLDRLNKIVPLNAVVAASDVVVYQLDDAGNIAKLPDYEGIPSDGNYLNQSLAEGNVLFDNLLEIEEDL